MVDIPTSHYALQNLYVIIRIDTLEGTVLSHYMGMDNYVEAQSFS